MKSASSVYLLPKGAIKRNSKLKLNKQSSNQKGSMHLTPIIKITPSKTISHGSDEKRLKIVSVSKKFQLKINDQENKIPYSQTAFQIHYTTNTQNQKNINKTEKNLKIRSISKNLLQIKEGEKKVPLDQNIQAKECIINHSEQIIKTSTIQSNQSLSLQNGIFNQKEVKFALQEKKTQSLSIKDDNIFEKTLNQNELPKKQQPQNQEKSIYLSLDILPQIIIQKDKNKSIIGHKSIKQLHLDSNVIIYTLDAYRGQIFSPSKLMNTSQKDVNEKLMHLDTINKTLSGQIKLLEQSKQVQLYLSMEISKKQLQLQQLQYKLSHLKVQLLNLSKQYELVVNFSGTQENNKILKMISKDYLQLQAEIYDYAVYLQSNQLANDINFQPRPFSEIQRLIFQREKDIKERLFENGIGVIDKSVMMSEFISETMRLFQKKDEEMQKLTSFRAKCILQFVAKMKRWLNNWQLKQEYLRNVRIEFIATLILLRNQMSALEEKICEKELSLQKVNKIANINEMIDKMELDFKLGNSFY